MHTGALSITPHLAKAADINGYSEAANAAKEQYHRDGRRLLTSLAKALGLTKGAFNIRSNKAGPAISGEITLHADHLYVQIHESSSRQGVAILYRSCRSQKDYTGGQNHSVSVRDLLDATKENRFVEQCIQLMEEGCNSAERERRTA